MLPSVSDILGQTLKTFHRHTRYFMRFMLIFLAIAFALNLAQDTIFSGPISFTRGATFVLYVVSVILTSLVTFWMYLGLLVASKRALDNEPPQPFLTTMKSVTPYLSAAAIAAIITSAMVLVGGLFFVLPGLLFLVWYAFTTHEVVFYNSGAIPALAESKRLVVGRWFAVAWRFFAPIFIIGFTAALIELFALAPFSWPHLLTIPYTLPALLANSLLIAILYAIIFPMITMAGVILFFALKEQPAPVAKSTPSAPPASA